MCLQSAKTTESVFCKYDPKGTPQMNKPSVCSGVWNRYDFCLDDGYFLIFSLLSCSCAYVPSDKPFEKQSTSKGPHVLLGCCSFWPALPLGMLGMSFLQLSREEKIFCALQVFQLAKAELMQVLKELKATCGGMKSQVSFLLIQLEVPSVRGSPWLTLSVLSWLEQTLTRD